LEKNEQRNFSENVHFLQKVPKSYKKSPKVYKNGPKMALSGQNFKSYDFFTFRWPLVGLVIFRPFLYTFYKILPLFVKKGFF